MSPTCHVFAYTRVYMHIHMPIFFFNIILMEEVVGTILAPQKFSILPGKFKVGHFYSTFIRGDFYERQRPPEKVKFSDH